MLDAILSGGNWEQLPAKQLHGLSGFIGNTALAELMTQRDTGPELAARRLPSGECRTAPFETSGFAEPLLSQTPEFGAMSPMGSAQPLVL